MKKSQNLVLFFAAIFAMMVAYVFAVVQLPGEPPIFYVVVAGLGVSALAQAGSDLLEVYRNRN